MSARREIRTLVQEAPVLRIVALVAVVLLTMVPASHAQIFLELEGEIQGPIQGDATFPGEEGRIEIFSLSWGTSRFIDMSGGGPGQIFSNDLALSKAFDASSIDFFQAQGSQERFSRCILHLYELLPNAPADGGPGLARRMFPPGVYLAIELFGARLTSYSTSSGPIGPASESIVLSYDSMRIFYASNGETYDDQRRIPARRARLDGDAIAPTRAPLGTDGASGFTLPVGDDSGVDVFDAQGHRVATVFAAADEPVDGSVRWDGTDDAGRPVPPGVYETRVRVRGNEVVRKMVIGQ